MGVTRPAGWLKDQLTLQAKGLSGQLPWFWSFFNESKWLGGDKGEPEQFIPYYINGMFPLSYQVDDPNLSAIRDRYVEYILSHQIVTNTSEPRGWLGPNIPNSTSDSAHNYWSKYLAVQGFQSYAEAIRESDPKQFSRVYDALLAHMRAFLEQLTTVKSHKHHTHKLMLSHFIILAFLSDFTGSPHHQ